MNPPEPRPVTVGVSLKMYFGHRQAKIWFTEVAERVRTHPAVASGAVEFFVIPTYPQLLPAVEAFASTPVRIGAQDVATEDNGAFTGEVSAVELAEIGVSIAEIGHAERRRLFGETDAITAAKAAAALRNGITPVLCIGETEKLTATDAAAATVAQLRACLGGAVPNGASPQTPGSLALAPNGASPQTPGSLAFAPNGASPQAPGSLALAPDGASPQTPGSLALAGAVIVAYEPVWAIGAPAPAPAAHISEVTLALRTALDSDPDRAGSQVIYGGSAGPGLLTELGDTVDGLFLGRFAHDPDNLMRVLDEAAALAASHPQTAKLQPVGETAGIIRSLEHPLQSRGEERGAGGSEEGGAP